MNPCPTDKICERDGSGGRNCIDPCDAKPCQNGGKCEKNGMGSYTCDCANTNFRGENCTEGKNYCL